MIRLPASLTHAYGSNRCVMRQRLSTFTIKYPPGLNTRTSSRNDRSIERTQGSTPMATAKLNTPCENGRSRTSPWLVRIRPATPASLAT